jgi:thioredoxin reductase
MLDVVVIGGSSAGLSAALVLGRARRHVVVLDDSRPANRFAQHSHGFFTRDGVPPSELVRMGREQLAPYTSVRIDATTATQIVPVEGGFQVHAADDTVYETRKILLATGVEDILPDLPGVADFWGDGVVLCPYCHGWEVRDQPLAVYNPTVTAFMQTSMIHNWSHDVTLCTGGADFLTPEQRDILARQNVPIITQPVARLEGSGGKLERIVFADGSSIPCSTIFMATQTRHRTPFAQDLGCKLTQTGVIEIDVLGRTSVPGVYAAGDIAHPARSIALSVAQGSMAASGINHELVSEDFR